MSGTLCKSCSRSQQRCGRGLWLRLTALFVLIERVWRVSHSLITSSSTLYTWYETSTFHTPVVEEVSGPRDISQAVLTAIFQAVSCNEFSSVFLNHYRTLRTKKRRRSKTSGFRKQGREGSTTNSYELTPLVYSCSSTCSSKQYLYFSWTTFFEFVRDPSYSLVLDWGSSRLVEFRMRCVAFTLIRELTN